MKKLYIYIHGKGGNAEEATHYASLFPEDTVVGFDYRSKTPWEAEKEFPDLYDAVSEGFDRVFLIANSIGAYFALCSLGQKKIKKAFFISPIVDMERLICDMMTWAGVSEVDLQEKGEIPTDFGETLSAKYLRWVRWHPVCWRIPTEILFGSADNLQSSSVIRAFAEKTGAGLTVMENGEHWFHTEEQMRFLNEWIKSKAK